MITTDFRPGTPCWLELNTPDVVATADFYHRVFGWTLHEIGFDAGGYQFLRRGDSAAAAIGPLEHEEQRPGWTLIFAVGDIEDVIDETEGRGGSVYVEPFAVPPVGRMAFLMDSLGGVFGVWQGQEFGGFEVVNEPDSFGWAELWTPDAAVSMSFYSGVFGWQYEILDQGENGEYAVVHNAGTSVEESHSGIMELGREYLADTEGSPDWHPVFMVADCDASARLVRDSGGKIHMGPVDIPQAGRMAVCADLVGAEFVLLTPSPTG
ncbi:VOC family protein [Nocardiopsis salina]|uniref:VOC family protein n=1 Tax=Nocardiopsis salina TaxID=245836 RepID=UPI00034C6C65|nr:VOC family protein [Nocardiopsis salina]